MSVYTATLTGSSIVAANEWFNAIFVTIQVLLSFFFFTAFVGLSLSPRLIQLTSTLQAMTARHQRRYSTFNRSLPYSRQPATTNSLSPAQVDDAPLPASIHPPPQRRRSTPAMDNVMKHLGLQLQQHILFFKKKKQTLLLCYIVTHF
ncbi:hypothetical protein Btru_033494 [Bulinus truncatus]|nr:hypothetical protein Btru_033494 [Bulinus truncatus]